MCVAWLLICSSVRQMAFVSQQWWPEDALSAIPRAAHIKSRTVTATKVLIQNIDTEKINAGIT